MPVNDKAYQQADMWERGNWLWQAIFYLAIAISLGFALRDDTLAGSLFILGILTLALVLWHSIGMALAYRNLQSWAQYPTSRFVVLMGDMVMWFILVSITPTYYITLFGLFIQVFRHLPVRYAAVTAGILTLLMFVEQMIDTGDVMSFTNANTWLFAFGSLSSVVISIWISAIIDQSMRRRELIEQLEATQKSLAEAERREGVLEERQRLAREIHDTLAQGFTSIVMHLEAAEQALPDDIAILQNHLNRARLTARESLGQARRVVQDLRPDLLEGNSLSDAIERTSQRWQADTNIPVIMQTTGDTLLTASAVDVTLLRATQEALNNIRKHAQASEVRITLSYMHDMIMLDIHDNGVGMLAAEPSEFTGSFGLHAMRERVTQFGGSLLLESDDEDGTTLTVSVPLHSQNE
ncbi:MAG: sensor histidine kinase [Chloroflexota bacterium]